MVIKKILCAIDFSLGSQRALREAARLAAEADGELVLVHVWYVPPSAFAGEYMIPPPVVQQMSDDASRGLDDAIRDAKTFGAKRVTAKLLQGVPWNAIVEMVDDPSYDLVVIGTHGRTGLSRVLLGSVAEKVVRHAPCSVLAVPADGEPKAFTHVLCPVDFSESSRYALQVAGGLVATGGAGITLLHVVETGYWEEPSLAALMRDLETQSTQRLDDWAAQLRRDVAVPVTTRTGTGWSGAGILTVLDDDPSIDLVVVGSHGRTGIKRAVMGSVAEKVVRHAKCPVLVARKRT